MIDTAAELAGTILGGLAGLGFIALKVIKPMKEVLYDYKYRKFRYKRKIKRAILDRDYESVNKYFFKLKAFDLEHKTTVHKRLMKLYNLRPDIINDETLFYKHYRIKVIVKEDESISYEIERSMTLNYPDLD